MKLLLLLFLAKHQQWQFLGHVHPYFKTLDSTQNDILMLFTPEGHD